MQCRAHLRGRCHRHLVHPKAKVPGLGTLQATYQVFTSHESGQSPASPPPKKWCLRMTEAACGHTPHER